MRVYSAVLCLFLFLISTNIAQASDKFFFDKNVTMKELAKKNNLSTFKLLHEMDDELGARDITKDTLVKDSGMSRKQFRSLYLHMHQSLTPLVLIGMAIWVFMSGLTIFWITRRKLSQMKRIVFFLIAIIFFGIILHAKPSAMESIVKFFKATAGKESWHLKVFFFSFFSLFSIVASNLFCSIGCQIGAIQDLIYQLVRKTKIKGMKIPFWISNSVRVTLFIFFVLFMFNLLAGLSSGSLYHNLNIFKTYIWGLSTIGIATLMITLVLSAITFRPFCAFICPFGLWSWAISFLSLFRIRIDCDVCIECKKCIKACPNDAMKAIYFNEKIKKDCYSCGECITSCPKDCIDFSIK